MVNYPVKQSEEDQQETFKKFNNTQRGKHKAWNPHPCNMLLDTAIGHVVSLEFSSVKFREIFNCFNENGVFIQTPPLPPSK